MNKRQARKIRYSMKKKEHKRYLKKSTRVDEENKKTSYWNFFFYANCA